MRKNLHCPLRKIRYLLVLFFSVLVVAGAAAQGTTVTGRVVDQAGEGLPGVSVSVKGTSQGTVTNIDGNYSLQVQGQSPVLVYSYIGYLPQEVPLNNRSTVNVTLAADTRLLDEVVVVGYGTQRKSDITGSISVVDVEDMKKTSTNDVGAMLEGRTTGVTVNTDGQPGAFPQVRIRGIGTFNNSDPLYVIDGVPISGVPRDFNPNDIESMQVLKDASAGAIYGSRAANGVIIITTKQGKLNTPLRISYDGYYGIDQVWQRMPVTSRANYQTLNNESRYNAGRALAPANDPANPRYISDIDTDWQEEGLKTGNRQNHTLTLSGGGAHNTYNISLDYFGNNGTYVGNGPDYKRYTARVNTTAEKGILKVGQTLFYARSNENRLVGGDGILAGGRPPLINDLVFAIPTMAVYDPANEGGFGGTLLERENAISLNGIGFNSLITDQSNVDRLFATGFAELELLKGLKYKLNLGYDALNVHNYNFVPTFNLGYFFNNRLSRLNDNTWRSESLLIENTLNYERMIGKHSFAVLVGQMYQYGQRQNRFGYAEDFTRPYFPVLNNGAVTTSAGTNSEHVIASYLSRINYAFADKYLITATMRRDGSSRFSPANKFGHFPSVAVGWKISNEPFFNVPGGIVSDLKLRASWGVLGNENFEDYQYMATINPNVVYTFNDGERVLGGTQTSVVSETLKWEEKATTNVGLDASFFNGAFDFSAEYYNSKSTDVLVRIPIPASVGSINAAPFVNAGTLQNSGFELATTYHKVKGDFQFDITANFTTLRNRVPNLGSEQVTERLGAASITELGGEIGRHYGWIADGIFQSQEEIDAHAFQRDGTAPGDIRFKDVSGPNGVPDGVIDPYDRTDLGRAIPKYTYGLNFNANYKRFDFTMFFSGRGGHKIVSRLYRDLMHPADANYHQDIINRWTTVNTNTNIPRLIWSDPNENARDSNREGWLQSGTYLRLNTISLGYNLKENLVKGISRARFYVTAQNLYTFQEYKGYNPDFVSGVFEPGFDNGSYPRPRTIMVGVNVGF